MIKSSLEIKPTENLELSIAKDLLEENPEEKDEKNILEKNELCKKSIITQNNK